MGKFIGLGALFQIVLLVSLLDVYIYKSDVPIFLHKWHDCSSYLVVFEVPSFQIESSEKKMRNEAILRGALEDEYVQLEIDSYQSYLYPERDEYMDQWGSMIAPWQLGNRSITDVFNDTEPSSNTSSIVFLLFVDFAEFNIQLAKRNVSENNSTLLTFVIDNMHDFAKNQSSSGSNSSVTHVSNTYTYNGYRFLLLWKNYSSITHSNTTSIHNHTFSSFINFADKVSEYSTSNRLQLTFPHYNVEGNLLDFFKFGLEAVNIVFSILNLVEMDIDPIVSASTYIMFVGWLLLLVVSCGGSTEKDRRSNSITLNYYDVLILVSLVCLFAIFAYLNYPIRYYVYYLAAIAVNRLLLQCYSEGASIIHNALNDKTGVVLTMALIFAVVEGLFWCLRCDTMPAFFIILVGGNIVEGTVHRGKFQTEIALAIATCFVGITCLLPSMHLNPLFLLNTTSVFWITGTVLSLVCFMGKTQIDWFLSVLCLCEHLLATIALNWYYAQRKHIPKPTIFCAVCFFAVLSGLLPLFGEPNPKFRIPQIGIAAASLFMFFSPEGEGIVLFSIFVTALCLCYRESASNKLEGVQTEKLKFLPILLQTAMFILAVQLIAPLGLDVLFDTKQFIALGVPLELLSVVLIYFVKLAFLVNLLEATFLSSYKKEKELPSLFLVILVLNLVSLRSVVHMSLFPNAAGKRKLFMIHILMHTLAATLLYLYPFVRVQRYGSFFGLCSRRESSLSRTRPLRGNLKMNLTRQ